MNEHMCTWNENGTSLEGDFLEAENAFWKQEEKSICWASGIWSTWKKLGVRADEAKKRKKLSSDTQETINFLIIILPLENLPLLFPYSTSCFASQKHRGAIPGKSKVSVKIFSWKTRSERMQWRKLIDISFVFAILHHKKCSTKRRAKARSEIFFF